MNVLSIKKFSSKKHKKIKKEHGSSIIPEAFVNELNKREKRRRTELYLAAFREIQLESLPREGGAESKWYEKFFDFGSGI